MNEFKVGDWVRHIESNNIYKINGFSIHGQTKGFIQIHDEYHLVPQSECELWQAKEGEWCWFWNRHTNISPLLRKFEYIFNGDFYTNDEMIFTHCEPFIGELQSFLKDKR